MGVVKSVDSKKYTTRVRRLKHMDFLENPCKFDGDDVVNVFELDEHPYYN